VRIQYNRIGSILNILSDQQPDDLVSRLCRLRITTVETSVKLADVTLINADFNLEQLAKATNTPFRNQMVVKSYKKYAGRRQRKRYVMTDAFLSLTYYPNGP
jgi:hypothetical protein